MTSRLKLIEGCALVSVPFLAVYLPEWPTRWDWPYAAPLVVHYFVLSLSWATAFYYNDLYDITRVDSLSRFVRRMLYSCLFAFALFLVLSIILQEVEPLESPSLKTFLITLAMILLLLLPLRAAVYAMLRRGSFGKRVVVLGEGPLGSKLVEELTRRPDLIQTVVSVPVAPISPQGAHESYERLNSAIETHRPDCIIVALSDRRNRLPVEYLVQVQLRGIQVENAVDVYERLTRKLALEYLTPSSFLFSEHFPSSTFRLRIHRVVSVLLAALCLIACAPLMALIALAVKLDSPGSVFFCQERVGLRGKIFLLRKFRTMRCAKPTRPHATWQRDDADRITRIGRWLRRSRLDELPQFWNVLRGDMNVIGPRPEMAENVETMTREIPFYNLRHIIRPGITGWAQVKHGYAVTRENVQEKIRYDLYYIKHMCFTLDLMILLESVKVVLFGRGTRDVARPAQMAGRRQGCWWPRRARELDEEQLHLPL